MDVRNFLLIGKRFIEEGKTEEAIKKTKEFIKGKDKDLYNKTIQISGIYSEIKDRKTNQLKVEPEEIRQVHMSIFQVINEIEELFEEEYWKNVVAAHQISVYEEYIESYPEGKHIEEAKVQINKIAELSFEQKEKDIELRKDLQSFIKENWQYALENNTIEDYEEFFDLKLKSSKITTLLEKIKSQEIKIECNKVISEYITSAIHMIATLKAEEIIKRLVKETGLALVSINNGVADIQMGNNIHLFVKALSYNHSNKTLTLQFHSQRVQIPNMNIASLLLGNNNLSLSYWGIQQEGNNTYFCVYYSAIAKTLKKDDFLFILNSISSTFQNFLNQLNQQNQQNQSNQGNNKN